MRFPAFFLQTGDWSSFLISSTIFLLILLFFYLFFAITLMMIAKKTNTSGGGLAWIPILNLFLMCRIAHRPAWWALMCFVPFLNFIFFIMLWMGIAEASGKSIFVGLMVIIPVVGLIVPAYLALTASPPPMDTIAPTSCFNCGTQIVTGECFCRQCGQAAPTMVKTSSRQQTSAGKLFLLGAGTAIPVLLLFGTVGWFSVSRALAYSPPERKAPEMPERTSGTLTEFPVDTDSNSPTEPGSIIVDDTQNTSGGKTEIATQIPQKRLPPGINRDTLKKRTTTATSVVYRRKSSTVPTDPEVYVNILRSSPGQNKVADALATEILKAANGATRTGTRVQSPRGGVYNGSRISTPQTNIYVLEKQNSDIVILIYSPTSAGNDTAARLAGNVGNGEGINDYPTIKSTLWTLPQRPANLTLVDFYTQTRNEMGLSESDLNNAKTDEETKKWIDYFSQFIPEKATNARYRDAQGKIWEVGVYDYETSQRAWNIWLLLKWTLGFSLQSTPLKSGTALYSEDGGERNLMFQKGMYLVIIKAPNTTPIENVAALGDSVQI